MHIFFSTLLFFLGSAQAAVDGQRIAHIEVRGLIRSDQSLILRELDYKEGDLYSEAAFREGLRRIRNAVVFAEVSGETRPNANDPRAVDVILHVIDRWTFLPVLRFGGGGGTDFYSVGAVEGNVAGRGYEAGIAYENYGGSPSGFMFLRDPRFLGKRIRVGLDLGIAQRTRKIYDPTTGYNLGAFGLSRFRFGVGMEAELNPYVVLGVGAERNFDRFPDEFLTDDLRARNAASGFSAPSAVASSIAKFYLNLGQLDWVDEYRQDGFLVQPRIEFASPVWGSEAAFTRWWFDTKFFRVLPLKANLGIRVRFGTIDSNYPSQISYFGGLDTVRGYEDGQFRGQSFFLGNVEYRIPSFDWGWLLLQHIFFVDTVKTDTNPFFMSFGTGIRFVCPKVYRFNIRLDAGFIPSGVSGQVVSFGFQQFF